MDQPIPQPWPTVPRLSLAAAIAAIAALGIVAALTLTATTSPSAIRLAAAGRIDPDAPVQAHLTATIAAPPAVVWRYLADIDAWPALLPAITAARLEGPLAPGTRFVWTTGGTRIVSTLRRVDPQHVLAWTGQADGVTAIHVWTLTALAPAATRVEEDESISGLPARLFLDSRTLASDDADWLRRLKRSAERLAPL